MRERQRGGGDRGREGGGHVFLNRGAHTQTPTLSVLDRHLPQLPPASSLDIMNRITTRSLGHYSILAPRFHNILPRRVFPHRHLHPHHSLRKSEGKLENPGKFCMTEIILLHNMILTSPQPITFDKIEWGMSSLPDTQEIGDTPKLRHLNRRGEGKIECVFNGKGRKRCAVSQGIQYENKRPVST